MKSLVIPRSAACRKSTLQFSVPNPGMEKSLEMNLPCCRCRTKKSMLEISGYLGWVRGQCIKMIPIYI